MDMVHGDQANVVEAEVEQTSIELNNRDEDHSMNIVSEPSSEGGKVDESENDTREPATNKPQTLPLLLIPSLKGKMTYEGGNVTCKGMWGMSDYAHTVPGQTSEFEFKLVKADEGSSLFPVNGKYQGYFMLKQAPPLKGSVKVEDKEMVFKFTRSDEEEGQYTIHGNGLNKFGSFTLKGKLSEDGDLHVYREYYNLTPAPVHIKRRLSVDGADEAPKPKKKALALKAEDSTVPPAPPVELNVSPREGAGRIRKQSSAMKEYIDTTVKPPPITPRTSLGGGSAVKAEKERESFASKPAKAAPAPVVMAPLARQESFSDRSHRLSFPLKKAAELLKEICKHPHSIWFGEPVDYVRLNIPDYPTIISHPMDFSTIRKRIETGVYEAIESFAEDMRLVFRNAITFNTQRDNPVHIAARELSGRFEDRYRVLTSQIGGVSAYSAGAILALESAKIPGSSSGKKNKTPRSSLGGAPVSKLARSSSGAGPRMSAGGAGMPYLPPAVDGSSAHQLMEMQRMMQAMQNEISTLKSQVRENEIVKRLQETKDAAHNPLTFEEKKTLIAQIHKLAPDKMEQVLVIIEDSLPADQRDQGEEIEVPLDALDTFTLRKLQRFIDDNSEKKKRPPAAQRQSTGSGGAQRGESAPKRPRKSASTSKLPGGGGGMGQSHLGMHHSHDDYEEHFEPEDMLFAPDSFEELKAHAQRDAAQHGSHGQHDDGGNDLGDDDEDFSSLVNINHASHDMTMNNMDAWNE